MSLQSLLSIARTALSVQQRAMDVTAHNIANANTPGYSRQRLVLQAASPLQLSLFPMGRGVEAVAIQRTRSSFYDASYRHDSGQLGLANTLSGYLGQVEAAMNEPSDTGLSASLDSLFASFSDLAGDPANHTNRELVVSAANRLAGQLRSLDSQLGRVNQNAVEDLNLQVADVNRIATAIANANARIVTSGTGNGVSPDLQDQRDALVDQLSQYGNVRTVDHGDGTVGVIFGDTTLVDGAVAGSLTVVNAGGTWGITSTLGGGPTDPQSGSMKAVLDVLTVKLPNAKAKLDALAGALVSEFNSLHQAGYTLSGATGTDFFDPAGTTAGTIGLSASVKSSSDNIAVSANAAQGNGDVAAQIAALAGQGVASLGGRTFREHFVSLASGIGLDVRSAQQDAGTLQALVDRSDASRQAASGVNVDEEMIGLVASQQAYQAAARLVSIADQMMQALLDAF